MLKAKVINYNNNNVYTAELAPRSVQRAECLIGRHPDCDLVLDGPAVSRVHGRVLFDGPQCLFTDLGSTDGSRLNNEEVRVNQSYAIAPDDVIRMGEFALIIEALNPLPQPSQTKKIWSGDEISARCVQIISETHDVKTFRFVAEPELLFDFKPGQFVTLKLPVNGKNSPTLRSYSISSSPSRPHTLDITVKRVGAANEDLPPGIASNWLHDQLKVGMSLLVQGPFGSFNCIDQPADKLLLISAGSGITPMMSMSQWLSDCAANTEIVFVHVARTPQDIIFRQRLALLAAQHPHFKLAFTLTGSAAHVPWMGYRGRLSPSLLTAICPDFCSHTTFVCGPAGFMESTQKLLAGEGLPMENYFEESFGPPAATKASPADLSSTLPSTLVSQAAEGTQDQPSGQPSVEFSVSERVIEYDPGDTLLEVAEQAGVAIASGCRMGSCGACKQSVAQGEVCYNVTPRGLSESDRAAGKVLACVAKPIGRVVLNL
ncbi:MAG: FHA domain-containing protein [Phormidesmis sp.]